MNKKENFSCGYYKDKQFFMQEETGSRSGKKSLDPEETFALARRLRNISAICLIHYTLCRPNIIQPSIYFVLEYIIWYNIAYCQIFHSFLRTFDEQKGSEENEFSSDKLTANGLTYSEYKATPIKSSWAPAVHMEPGWPS